MVSDMAKYFAYGSNLNVEVFDAWCERRGYSKGLLRFYATAQLPDYDLVFRHFSTSRRGGVLHIQPRVGQLVPGVLFETDEDGLAALDRKEGAPGVYKRCQVTVINDAGMEESAISYRLCSEHEKGFVQPSSAYVDLVRQGLANFGLPTDHLELAVSNKG